MDIAAARAYFLGLQERIVSAAAALDGQPFLTDAWSRPPGGKLEGKAALITGGDSGIGRENGRITMEYYTQLKSVYVAKGGIDAPY